MVRAEAHIEKVLETAASPSGAAHSRLAASWRRSVVRHGLDPAERRGPDRLDARALHHRIARLETFLEIATPRLDKLFTLVGSSGCAVVLTDAEGVVLKRRTSAADEAVFAGWGLAPGADWSEAAEGTNGIGTCLAENRRVTIHRDEHFYARNTAMSCMDAPIYGHDGQLLGALDVSSARADQTEGFNRLIAAQVAMTARAIEEANFRATFAAARMVQADTDMSDEAVLIAVDDDDLVIGATRRARRLFGLGAEGPIVPRPAADILGRDDGPRGFERAERAAVIRALSRAGGNVSEAARALGIGRATLYRRMNRLGIGEN